ncbi:MAG: phosphatase PAP2 family protein [Holophaga sp.]|nr:phosphatase PAP2 family protein [Holophaga sp.]
MKHFLKAWVIAGTLVLGAVGSLRAEEPPAPRFLVRADLDLAAELPHPPALGSLAALGDFEAVLQAQVWRTADQVAWAKAVDKGTVWDNADVLGAWFMESKLPRLALFFRDIGKDLRPVSAAAKKRFDRPRPPKVDARIKPCIDLPDSGSYPSGHSLYIFMEAEVLSEIFPEVRKELFDRAHRAAWGRILGGVHFPTDVVGGRLLAKAFVAEIKKSRAFQEEVAACRAEAAPFLMKKAG